MTAVRRDYSRLQRMLTVLCNVSNESILSATVSISKKDHNLSAPHIIDANAHTGTASHGLPGGVLLLDPLNKSTTTSRASTQDLRNKRTKIVVSSSGDTRPFLQYLEPGSKSVGPYVTFQPYSTQSFSCQHSHTDLILNFL